MPSTVTVSEARASISEIVDRVRAGEEVTLTRHGVAVAVVVKPDALRIRRVGGSLGVANSVHDLVEHGADTSLTHPPAMTSERADALVAEVRDGRSRS